MVGAVALFMAMVPPKAMGVLKVLFHHTVAMVTPNLTLIPAFPLRKLRQVIKTTLGMSTE